MLPIIIVMKNVPFLFVTLVFDSVTVDLLHPEEIWWQRFEPGVWSTFHNTSKIFLIYIILHIFIHFLLAV